MKETDLQTDIKKSVREQGGYAFKLTNAYTIGIPDLLIALPPFAPCTVEVKELGDVTDKFDQTLRLTEKQRHELKGISKPYNTAGAGDVSFILVGLVYQRQRLLIPLPKEVERLSYRLLVPACDAWKRLTGGRYDIKGIMENLGGLARVIRD